MEIQNAINILYSTSGYLSIVISAVIRNKLIAFLSARNTQYVIVIRINKSPSTQDYQYGVNAIGINWHSINV